MRFAVLATLTFLLSGCAAPPGPGPEPTQTEQPPLPVKHFAGTFDLQADLDDRGTNGFVPGPGNCAAFIPQSNDDAFTVLNGTVHLEWTPVQPGQQLGIHVVAERGRSLIPPGPSPRDVALGSFNVTYDYPLFIVATQPDGNATVMQPVKLTVQFDYRGPDTFETDDRFACRY